jgi:hypothetical protein
MDTGAKKRKRSSVKEFCTNCGKDGGNGKGHLVQYCGFVGGRFYNPSAPEEGQKKACKQKFEDIKAMKKGEQVAMIAATGAKEQQTEEKMEAMAKEIKDLKKSVQKLMQFKQHFTAFYQETIKEKGKVKDKGKGKVKGKGKGQLQSQSQRKSKLQPQPPSQIHSFPIARRTEPQQLALYMHHVK